MEGCSSGACESGAVEAEVQIQAFNVAGLVWESFVLEEGLDPVSYTHLDVYKRQVYR